MKVAVTVKPAKAKRKAASGKFEIERAPAFRKIGWLVDGFSTRVGGVSQAYGGRSLNLGFTEADQRGHVLENRKRLLVELGAATGGKPWPLIVNRQIHSDIIHVVRNAAPGQLAGDGLITDRPGVALALLTADCLPVLLVDRKKQVIGAFHAGWRGTRQRIAEKGLGTMRREFGSRPEDVYAAIGPGIQKCCYEVGEELKEQFESQFPYWCELFHEVQESDPVRKKYPLLFMNQRPPGHGDLLIKLHLDLREANRRQFVDAGVPANHIWSSSSCTACDTGGFFSYRAEKGHTGRMMAVIGMKP